MAEMIKFLKGSLSRYNELKAAGQISEGTLYFCTEGALYLGSSLIAEINMTDEGSVKDLIAAALAPYYTSVQVDGLLANYYTKGEVDGLLADYLKTEDFDLSGYYTKGEVDKIHADADEAISKAISDALTAAQKYADDNDSDTNTAHTHVNGTGTIVTAEGGIDGEVAVDLNIGIKLENDNLVIYDKTSNTAIASMDAADLVEDSYLSDVTVTGDKELEFTFTLSNGTTKTVDVDLTSLVDVYTGDTGSEIVVSVEGYTVSASLTKAVTDDIAKGVEAHGWGNHANEGYAHKVDNATEDFFVLLTADGDIKSAGYSASEFVVNSEFLLVKTDVDGIKEGSITVPNATHATNADTLDGKSASDFVSSAGYVAYSQDEKTKLAGIEAGAQVNVIEEIAILDLTGSEEYGNKAISITDKKVTIDSKKLSVQYAENAENATAASHAESADTASVASSLDADYRAAIVNDSCNVAKTAIQGNTAVTVEECVNAINTMNSKVNEGTEEIITLTDDVKDVVSSIDTIMEMLTWGDFPEVKNN